MQIYIVAPNDSVDSIARKFEVSAQSIIYNNQLTYPYPLAVGQALLLSINPNLETNRQDVFVNGYAYPFIDSFILTQTLPYLSQLSIFSYGFTAEGELIPPKINEDSLIENALKYNVAPILTLTPFGPDGMFNNYLISRITNDLEAQAILIEHLADKVIEKKYQGVDIDFEYILPKDKYVFADFVANVRARIHQLGYPVSVALAPKTSDDQKGLLYEGKDYALLGEAADCVLLMTYEWGYTYGPPMAVAPIESVRQVVEYALTRIPAEKINLGIPNYGYDWPLPYKKGTTAATSIGNIQAVQIAIENNATIQYDEAAQAPFFTYTKDQILHEVWFEDVRSMNAKFNLIEEYKLRGMGYWQLMRLFRANWLLLADRFTIL